MKQLKKKHHYIWEHYLKPWTKNGQIHCIRNNKKFLTSTENIGQKRFFYKAIPLGENEEKFIHTLINQIIPDGQKQLNIIFNLYQSLSTSKNEYDRKCGIEDIHSVFESNFIKILDKLYQEDLSFFNNSVEKDQFSLFLGLQYTRTLKMKENIERLNLEKYNLNSEKLSVIMSLINGEIIAKWIYYKSKIQFLINNNEEKFITSDQPIINVKNKNVYQGKIKGFELYYPISPKYAIYLSENLSGKIKVDNDTVKKYNNMIKNNHNEQLYLNKFKETY
jgi:hypothetical protein